MASGAEQGSFSFPSSSGISRRPVNPVKPGQGAPRPPPRGRGGPLALHPDIDPPPPPLRPAFQLLAFVLILFFAALQFLPATHFRDPSDPLRKWIPFGSLSSSAAQDETQSETTTASSAEIERINIVSWVDCLDLRVLAVFINSTLSSSRVPEKMHFHFIISENEDEKLSYYKLKVLFPDTNLDIIGQKEIKDKTKITAPVSSMVHDIVPFVIPKVYPSLNRFIYVSPNTIMKGTVEELLEIKLAPYAVAAVEDCSKSLGSYVNIDVLNAIQRTAAKPWVSEKPYDGNACAPDLNVLLIDAKRLDKYLMDAFLWWNKVLDKGTSSDGGTSLSIILTLYGKYLKLSSTWKFVSKSHQADEEIKVLSYDGEMRACLEIENKKESSFGDVWRHYLPQKSEVILGH